VNKREALLLTDEDVCYISQCH